MGRALGFKWSMDQNVQNVVAGPMGGTPVVNGANQTGSNAGHKRVDGRGGLALARQRNVHASQRLRMESD
jgi:hypothetical protein